VDRALGTLTVAEALRLAGCRVEIHDRHFAQDARYADWLAAVGRRGWVVLTKDHHIRTRQSELIALLAAGVAADRRARSLGAGLQGAALADRYSDSIRAVTLWPSSAWPVWARPHASTNFFRRESASSQRLEIVSR
jgi:hypothetical protein